MKTHRHKFYNLPTNNLHKFINVSLKKDKNLCAYYPAVIFTNNILPISMSLFFMYAV